MSTRLTGISSMATKGLLAELAAMYRDHAGVDVAFESVGGVDAARRVLGGEAFDVVVLAADAIDRLAAGGASMPPARPRWCARTSRSRCLPAPRARTSARRAALRDAVLARAGSAIPPGRAGSRWLQLFDRWGITRTLGDRLMQAPPGVPVASLVAAAMSIWASSNSAN